ncbi:MAG: hypothetical protein AB7U38_10495 [Hyphomicrobiales bacterium]
MLLSLPYLILPLIAYNAIVFGTGASFDTGMLQVNMLSGAVWRFTLGDLMLTGTLLLLFIEILKATRTGGNSLVDHALSTIVFIICLIEFLVVPEAATSLFFLITIVCLIDVIAGFSVTIRAARRDFSVGPGAH